MKRMIVLIAMLLVTTQAHALQYAEGKVKLLESTYMPATVAFQLSGGTARNQASQPAGSQRERSGLACQRSVAARRPGRDIGEVMSLPSGSDTSVAAVPPCCPTSWVPPPATTTPSANAAAPPAISAVPRRRW
jgi:hypothetical protein